MKERILKISLAIAFFGLLIVSCKEKNETAEINDGNIIPEYFTVEVPSVITQESSLKGDDANMHGGVIYKHMGTFVAVGKGAATIVQDIITAIRTYKIDKPMRFSYKSGDDNRTKNVTVVENSEFEGINWKYELTITDADSESEANAGMAMQLFWNINPVKGIAILHPYNINRNETGEWASANFRIDYSEESAGNNYEKEMIVSISDLSLPDTAGNEDARYAMQSLKMFVGKKGSIFDLYGNSNHPNATFFSDDSGFNWAFVASADNAKNIGIAEVGLPMSGETSKDRNVLIKQYAIRNVFRAEILKKHEITEEILAQYPTVNSIIDAALANTEPPAYFASGGFEKAGVKPNESYNEIIPRIENLTPYVPNDISALKVEFKK